MPEMTHSGTVEVMNNNATPVSIAISRGQKGGYGWEIKVYDRDFPTAIARIREADRALREEYLIEEKQVLLEQ